MSAAETGHSMLNVLHFEYEDTAYTGYVYIF